MINISYKAESMLITFHYQLICSSLIKQLKAGVGKIGQTSKSQLDFESISLKKIPLPPFRPPSKATPPKHKTTLTILYPQLGDIYHIQQALLAFLG